MKTIGKVIETRHGDYVIKKMIEDGWSPSGRDCKYRFYEVFQIMYYRGGERIVLKHLEDKDTMKEAMQYISDIEEK